VDTREWYRFFAEVEAAGSSPAYERAARAVAGDDRLIGLLDRLPAPKRQPNLLFAACRYLGASFDVSPAAIEFMLDRWSEVRDVMLARSTQTNEPARTASFLPLLAGIDGPIALIEVGASAGLCLYPDHYRITYDDHPPIGPGDSMVGIAVRTEGPVPVPEHSLDIAWRVGVDLEPLDVNDDEDVAWLSACVWPEHTQRLERLREAVALVAADPPTLVRGDLVDGIDELLSSVPAGLTPVVIHSAVLGYLSPDRRSLFAERVRAHRDVCWFSNEGSGVVESLRTGLEPPAFATSRAFFVVGVSGESVAAISDPHGSWLRWGASPEA
jgi:hypothetical protein